MSNFLAVATITAVIKKILENCLADPAEPDPSGVNVTTVSPDKLSEVLGKGVNLYLYMVTSNTALSNADLPNYSSEGKLVQRPHVALDLHYLLTFYGKDEGLEPQLLLGKVVRTLHSRSILTRKIIEKRINEYVCNTSDTSFCFIQRSNLAEALETIKFTPVTLSLDEMSKLWSIFFQTPHRLSVAYIASVVLIESEDVPQSALPVRERSICTASLHQPIIEKVLSDQGANKPIVANSKLVIRGKKLREEITHVRINGIEEEPENIEPESINETQITILLPSSLSAGVHGLQIVHQKMMGKPSKLHNYVESNISSFVLHPTIEEIEVSNRQGTGDNLRSADLKITVNPAVVKKQRIVLIMNEISSVEPASYTFVKESSETNVEIKMHISGVKAAEYLIRVQVDGAQSQLIIDTNDNSPTFNQYISPKVGIL